MYKSSQSLTQEVFKVELETDNGESIVVSVFPPSLSVIREFQRINQESETALEDTISVVAKIISRNREKKTFSSADIENLFDVFEISDFITDFIAWVDNVKKK